jgi:hypothetical protein
MSGRDLPMGISIRQVRLEDDVAGVYFDIARDGHRVAFGLHEGDAIAVALAILGVSIEIRDAGRPDVASTTDRGRTSGKYQPYQALKLGGSEC